MWLDEATSALASNMSFVDIFTKFLPGDFHPPLYYVLLKCWVYLFGSSEIVLRIPSVIFGIGTIYMTYLVAKKLFNKNIALTASLLLSTSSLAIYYSQEARMYSMVTFLVSLAAYLFIENKYLYFSLVLALIGLTDYVALFILPIFWYLAFWRKNFLFTTIPLIGVYLFWLPIFLRQLTSGLSTRGDLPEWWGILGAVTFKNIALFPIKFILGRISFDSNLIYGLIFIPIFILYAYLLFKAKSSPKILWFWMFVPIVLGILIGFKIPTLSYFRFIFCLPPLYMLLAEGLYKFNGMKFVLITLAIISINIVSSGYYLLNPKFHREDWRRASIDISSDPIILPANSQKEALIYYGKVDQTIYYKKFEGNEKVIWLSRYVWEIFDKNDEARRKVENLGYNKILEANFNGVVFWKYAHSN